MKQFSIPLIILLLAVGFMIIFPNVSAATPTPAPGACQERPACLDATPPCKPPEPQEGWCGPGCFYQEVQCIIGPCYPVLVCPSPTPQWGTLSEGDMVSATGTNDPDIYIVNEHGYKRLFLNPIIFEFYGHLGGWHKVKSITASQRDSFYTSTLFKNCETRDSKVWAVEVTGEDTAVLHHMQMTGEKALEQDHNFFKRVFCINSNEFNWYTISAIPYTSVGQAPGYTRN